MSTTVQKYLSKNADQWNAFIKQSINGTFLFDRSFMEYHSDRFIDHSLMIYENDTLIGVVPAHIKDNGFYSHRGLTYGVPVLAMDKTIIVMDAVLGYLKRSAFSKAEFNMTSQIYNPEHLKVLESLLASGFRTQRISNNMYVNLKEDLHFSPKKTIGYRNGKFYGFEIKRGTDFKSFWQQILIPSLQVRHDSKPVHSIEEIELLASCFPDEIIQHNLYRDKELLAGITFFIKGKVIKSQYTASSPAGMKVNAAGFIYMEAMKEYKANGFYFMDLGAVNEVDGTLNKGLMQFKKELGSEMEEVMRLVNVYE